jgi:hypothetical protein
MRWYLGPFMLAVWLAGCTGQAPPAPPAQSEGAMCLAHLDEAGVRYSVEAVPSSLDACSVATPVRVTAAGIAWNQAGVVSCGFALALDAFAREEVIPSALAHFGRDVRLIRHFGTYACRRENGGEGRWSQHAAGRAIDIAGFDLSDGATILVERDWRGAGAKSAFLHDIARRACHRFSVVLTPDSDADHYNHIHIDTGPWKLCER